MGKKENYLLSPDVSGRGLLFWVRPSVRPFVSPSEPVDSYWVDASWILAVYSVVEGLVGYLW